MKIRVMAMAAASALLLLLGAAASAEGPSLTVSASIDGECQSVPGSFTVPAGKRAGSFERVSFTKGTACDGGGAPDNQGFAIYDSGGNAVYMWSRYKDQAPYERGGPLEGLSLDAGGYTLSVAGGAGARIELKFELH